MILPILVKDIKHNCLKQILPNVVDFILPKLINLQNSLKWGSPNLVGMISPILVKGIKPNCLKPI